jgi:hypothetical protein
MEHDISFCCILNMREAVVQLVEALRYSSIPGGATCIIHLHNPSAAIWPLD